MPVLIRNEEIYIGTSEVPYLKTFHRSESHTEDTTYYFSGRWGIRLSQATRKLKKTTQMFLRSAFLPFERKYHTDRVFTRKTL